MWLAFAQRLIAGLWKLQIVADEFRRFCWLLAAVWDFEGPEEGRLAMPHLPRTITSGKRTYSVEHKVAAGDLCDVHLALAGRERFVIKAPRVAGSSADALLEKEKEVLWQLNQAPGDTHHRLYFPETVESIGPELYGSRVNVFAWRDGFFTAGEIITRYPAGLDGRHLAWMFKRILAALGYAHRQGWVHGAVTPPHLLFHAENHGLQLIDWIHAVRPGEPLTFVPAEFREWYPPECRFAAEPASDIYLAAKSLIGLAGGDPARNIFPDHTPRPMRDFLEGCLLESARMRPQDAWELHDEFDELLGQLYGAPQYVRLEM